MVLLSEGRLAEEPRAPLGGARRERHRLQHCVDEEEEGGGWRWEEEVVEEGGDRTATGDTRKHETKQRPTQQGF